MKLQLKVVLILTGMWLVISLSLFIDSRLTLVRNYEALERNQVVADIQRVNKSFDNMLDGVRLMSSDWSSWDDLYQFIQGKNKKFISINLRPTTFINTKTNIILFFDHAGKLIHGQNYNLKENQFVPLPKNLISYFAQNNTLIKFPNVNAINSGLIKLPEGYLLFSAKPISNSTSTAPINGALVVGYFLGDSQIDALSKALNMRVHFYSLPLTGNDSLVTKAYDALKKNQQYYIHPQDKKFIYGFNLIHDVQNQPVALLKVEVPRILYTEGLLTIKHYFIIILTLGVIVLVSVWYLLKLMVLDRLIKVSDQVVKINSQSNFSNRITISGHDEINQMVAAFNSLMEIIELTQEQLRHGISQRTEKLERLSVLNKNLFQEISKQKEVETKLRSDEKMLKQMAYYDSLTGLPNRIFFNELLDKTLLKAKNDNASIAILFIDIDKFKSINDVHGHNAGDKFLIHVSNKLKAIVTELGMAGRFSGDEFVMFLMGMNKKAEIDKFFERMIEKISTPLKIGSTEIVSTFSVGVSFFPEHGDAIEDLEKNADIAMYHAKRKSGNSICYFNEIRDKQTAKF